MVPRNPSVRDSWELKRSMSRDGFRRLPLYQSVLDGKKTGYGGKAYYKLVRASQNVSISLVMYCTIPLSPTR
jgi:hypothetical protein